MTALYKSFDIDHEIKLHGGIRRRILCNSLLDSTLTVYSKRVISVYEDTGAAIGLSQGGWHIAEAAVKPQQSSC